MKPRLIMQWGDYRLVQVKDLVQEGVAVQYPQYDLEQMGKDSLGGPRWQYLRSVWSESPLADLALLAAETVGPCTD